MHHLIVSLGSNCGNRSASVARAIEWLFTQLKDVKSSDIYETPPYGHAGSNYINAVVAGTCDCEVSDFESACKRYEKSQGRDEVARRLNLVPIDIDVVVADGEVLRPKDFSRGFFRIGYDSIITGKYAADTVSPEVSRQYLDAR